MNIVVIIIIVLCAVSIILLVYMNRVEANRIVIENLELQNNKLKKTTNILFLSDLHLYKWMNKRRIDNLIKAIKNALKKTTPDIILIGGDIIDHNSGLEVLPKILEVLKSKSGIYAVLGNHDYFQYNFSHICLPCLDRKLADTLGLVKILRQYGIEVLRDKTKDIVLETGEKISILGIDYITFLKKNTDKLKTKNNKSVFKILLSHYPEVVSDFKGQADLILAGHTHGGQITLFGKPLIVRSKLKRSYVKGKSKHGETVLYVSKGCGVSRYIPLRFFSTADITMIKYTGFS